MRDGMKILLLCAGGASTGLLMQKMNRYAHEQGITLKVEAHGVGSAERYAPEFDVILIGPQVRFKLTEVEEVTHGMPAAIIPPMDYGRQNVAAILALAEELYAEKDPA